MTKKRIAASSRLDVAARLATVALVSAALAVPGCSNSGAPTGSNAVPGTPAGDSLAPGGPIKPNATPSKGAAKAEPI